MSRYPSYPHRSPGIPARIVILLITVYLLVLGVVGNEVRVVNQRREFQRLDSMAVLAQDLVSAYDALRQPAQWRVAITPEADARYTTAVLEAEAILKRATALEHATAYPCTIRTFYRECFR